MGKLLLLSSIFHLNSRSDEHLHRRCAGLSIHLQTDACRRAPVPTLPVLSAAATRCHCGLFLFSFPFSTFSPFKLLTPFPIGNRWETFAVGYCQMEQILITTSASSVYSLGASPPPFAPLCHLMCSTLVSDADVSLCYASFC